MIELLAFVPFFIGFFLLVILVMGSDKRNQASFEKRFPPISEAEFVARCTPGTDPSVALKMRRLVADRLRVEYDRVHPSTRFVEDLGVDC